MGGILPSRPGVFSALDGLTCEILQRARKAAPPTLLEGYGARAGQVTARRTALVTGASSLVFLAARGAKVFELEWMTLVFVSTAQRKA